MYSSHFEIAHNQITEGVKIKVLHQEDSMLMTEFVLQKGSLLPEHIHQSEHSAYLLQGKIRMVIDGISSEFVQGDSWCINKNICHYTEALEDSRVLELFNPENENIGLKIHQQALVLES